MAHRRTVACLLGLVLLAAACRPPEHRYWRDRRARPRPLPKPKLIERWETPLPYCPDRVEAREGALVVRRGDAEALRVDADGTHPLAEPGTSPPAIAEDPRISAALSRRYGRVPEHTRAARWRDLAILSVPESRAVHAVRLGKERIVWTVLTAARVVLAPQVHHSRVLVQSLDNYLYCLVPDNGHELWRAAASHRLTRAAAFWNDRVIVVPETSRAMQLFDLYDGSPAGVWTLPHPADLFRGAPAVAGNLVAAPYAPVGSDHCSLAAVEMVAQSPKPSGPP